MQKAGFTSRKITQDTGSIKIIDVTSLSVSNYGNTDLYLTVNDIERKVPAFDGTIGVPFGSFNLPGDGTACDLELRFRFVGGTGEAILDYRKTVEPITHC